AGAQHRAAEAAVGAHQRGHDLVFGIAALERMRMADDGDAGGLAFRRIDENLEIAGGAAEQDVFSCHASSRFLNLETFDGLAVLEMGFNDFVDIFLVDEGVPDSLRIHHHDRALVAAVKAAGTIDAHLAFAVQLERLDLVLGVSADLLDAVIGTTGFAVLALVGAEKNVVFEMTAVAHCGSPGAGYFLAFFTSFWRTAASGSMPNASAV